MLMRPLIFCTQGNCLSCPNLLSFVFQNTHVSFCWFILHTVNVLMTSIYKYRNRFWDPALRHPLGGQVVLVQRVNLEHLEHLEHLEREGFLEAKENEAIRD